MKLLPPSDGLDFKEVYPDAPDIAINLLKKILVLDPTDRLTAAQALAHPFFDDVRQSQAEGIYTSELPRHVDSFDHLTLDDLKCRIFAEVGQYDECSR